MLLWFGGLGGGAATAPLAGAAIAPGLVCPDGSRRTVQLFEGGIIRDLLVTNGSAVTAGDPLVVLEDVGARAARDARMGRYRVLGAIEARLVAEADDADVIDFPRELISAADGDPEIAEAISDQISRFDVRRRTHDGRRAILRQRVAQLQEQIAGLEAQIENQDRQLDLARTVVAAPVSGTVVGIRFRTRGGVTGAGEPILDIVPAEEDLLIEARVSPTDIDSVAAGQAAQVHLTAYRQRTMRRIEGRVRHVSADRIMDEGTSQPYFLARVEVDRQQLTAVGPDVQLVPGMPAEVLILTGELIALAYLMDPFINTIRRAMREQ